MKWIETAKATIKPRKQYLATDGAKTLITTLVAKTWRDGVESIEFDGIENPTHVALITKPGKEKEVENA